MDETKILEQLNVSYVSEYNNLVDKTKLLDQRISIVLTLTGIIMTALVFFLRDAKSCENIKVLIVLAIIGIGVTFFFSIKSKILKKVHAPPLGTEIYVMTMDLIKNNSDETYKNYFSDLNCLWLKANEDLKSLMDEKFNSVRISQWSIFITTMLIVIGLFIYYI
jgi:hypothetical protein